MVNELAQLESLFKALADATRLRIVGLLLAGEVCVCHIHQSLRITQPKASRHLAYLRRVGLVTTRRRGLWVYYRLAEMPDTIAAAVLQAVTGALPRVDIVKRDLRRLQKKTGCCVPAAAPVARLLERAKPSDLNPILELLARNNLPIDGLAEHLDTTIVAREAGKVVGCAALEIHGTSALLRSVSVDPELQGRGLGHQLTQGALRVARSRGVGDVYLLTTTAERFFPRLGFEPISRSEVPANVQASVEFTSACPTTAAVMRRSV